MSVAFVLFMGVFIKCCAVHTPSSNPNKMPALSITQTLRHPYSTLRRKRHHPVPQQQQPTPSAPYIAAHNPADVHNSSSYNNHGEGRNQYSRPKGKSCWHSISNAAYCIPSYQFSWTVISMLFKVNYLLTILYLLITFSGGPASGWGNRGESSPYAYSGHGGRANAYEMNVRQHRV